MAPDAEVFVSYASRNRDRAAPIVTQLQSSGVMVSWDRDVVSGGRNYGPEIVRSIKACKVLVLMCTEASLRSRNVKQEIQLAWRYQRPYIPLLIENIEHYPEQIEYWLEKGGNGLKSLAGRGVVASSARGACRYGGNVRPSSGREPAGYPSAGTSRRTGRTAGAARFTDQIWPVPAEYAWRTIAPQLRDLGVPQDHAVRRFRLGSRVCLAIEWDRPGHILLLDIGTSGKVYCPCPSNLAANTQVTPGRT